jgi:hypothetical protein
MEEMPREEKFKQKELEALQDELISTLNPKLATEAVARFFERNGYGVNHDAIYKLITNNLSTSTPEEFKKELEALALEN